MADSGIVAAAKAAAAAAKAQQAKKTSVGSSVGSGLASVGASIGKAVAAVAPPTAAAPPASSNPPQGEPKGDPGGASAGDPGSNPFTRPIAAYDPNQATSFLQQFGINDAEVQNVIDQVFRSGGSPDQALAALRGTKWYANNYQGIFEGIAKGVVSNEADYRNMLNQTNQLYQRYYGKQVDAGTFANYLKNGTDIGTIGRHLSGESAYNAAAPTLDYQLGAFDPAGALTATEQQAYGDQLGGLQNPLGDKIALRVQQAQQRIAKVFEGSLASPGLTSSNGRLASTTTATNSDIGA